PDPAEDDPVRRYTGQIRAVQLAGRYDVRPCAELGEEAQNRQIPVRLDRIGDQVGVPGQSTVQILEPGADRPRTVDVEWRTPVRDHIRDGNTLAVEDSRSTGERLCHGLV